MSLVSDVSQALSVIDPKYGINEQLVFSGRINKKQKWLRLKLLQIYET